MSNATQLLMKLQQHIGKANGITGKNVALALDVPPRQIRRLVEELRLEGHAVCGYPGEGYYIAANAQEIEDTCAFLHSRAMSSLKQESVMSKCAVPVLSGQMNLET